MLRAALSKQMRRQRPYDMRHHAARWLVGFRRHRQSTIDF
jgi:hypothetical protein